MSQHTPGPWRVRDATTHVLAIESPDEALICYLIHAHDAESHANARLIAAAPAMLDLLTALWEHPAALRPAHAQQLVRILQTLGIRPT